MKIPMFPIDKVNHYMYSNVGSFLILSPLKYTNDYLIYVVYILILIGLIGFEYYQKKSDTGVFSWWDWAFGVAGATVSLLAILL